MIVGVVLPTVDGREGFLRRAIDTHTATPWPFATKVVVQVERGHATCGEAWNAGVRALRETFGTELRYVCFSADDLEAHPGWLEEAIRVCELGELPAPFLYRDELELDPRTVDGVDGELVAFSRVPFFSFDTWLELGPCPPLHYFSDVYYGHRAEELGYSTRLAAGYAFTHRWAEPGRIHDPSLDAELLERILLGGHR